MRNLKTFSVVFFLFLLTAQVSDSDQDFDFKVEQIDCQQVQDIQAVKIFLQASSIANEIEYTVEKSCQVEIIILNILGQQIDKINVGRREPGQYTETWPPKKFIVGIYFAKIMFKNIDD